MISDKINALFNFIDYLDSRKTELINTYLSLCSELSALDVQRAALKPRNNYNDKLKYDFLQQQISEKFEPITEFVYKPIVQKLLELKIWSGEDVYTSIFNNNIGAIIEQKENFTLEDVTIIIGYKSKYLNFRRETGSGFLCLEMVFSCLDEILKELFDYFKDTTENEFDSFEAKVIPVESITEAVDQFQNNKGRHVKFSLPHDAFYQKAAPALTPNQILFVKNDYHMGDTFNGINNSTIYNRSTFSDAFNSVKTKYSEDSARALEIVRALVEGSKDQQAGEVFDSFNEELSKEKPRTSVLQNLWGGLIKLVPLISETVGLVDKILPLLQH
jgi:hypothetical protein